MKAQTDSVSNGGLKVTVHNKQYTLDELIALKVTSYRKKVATVKTVALETLR